MLPHAKTQRGHGTSLTQGDLDPPRAEAVSDHDIPTFPMNSHDTSSDSDPTREAEFQHHLARCRAGDQQAIGLLVDQFRLILLEEVNRNLDQDLRAKVGCSDVVQDTLWEAQRRFAQFVGEERGEFLAWLHQIARNDVRETVRRYKLLGKRNLARETPIQGNASEVGVIDPRHSPVTDVILKEQAAMLYAAIAGLRPEYQQVLQLRNWRQLPFADIGEIMGRSAEAARKLWSRALIELQAKMAGLSSLVLGDQGSEGVSHD